MAMPNTAYEVIIQKLYQSLELELSSTNTSVVL